MTADSDEVRIRVQNELRVSLLGALAATVDGQELTLGPPRQRAVLAVLALRANHVVSRSELIDAVWGDDPPASADNGIHTYVAGLRRLFEPGRASRAPSSVLLSTDAGYLLRLPSSGSDAARFRAHLDDAGRLRGQPAEAISAFDAALEGINRLKRIVPIWKKEHFADGEVWVDGEWDEAAVRK